MITLLYTIVLVFFALVALLIFGMAQAAGQADELSERIYYKEMEKIQRHNDLMKEADENPEYIAREDR